MYFTQSFKGIVPSKMKILSSFTHSHVIQLVCISFFCGTQEKDKEDILKNVCVFC